MWQLIACIWIAAIGGVVLNIRGHQLAGVMTVVLALALLSWLALCPMPRQYLSAASAVVVASPTNGEYHIIYFDSPEDAERGGWVKAAESISAR